MKPKLENSLVKPGRYRCFQMQISLGINGPRINLHGDTEKLNEIMTAASFVSQIAVENTLFHLEIKDRGRFIRLKRFYGQLERDSDSGAPYWNIFLQTTALITARRIAIKTSKDLFKSNNTVDSTIQIFPTISLGILQKENRLIIPNSCWYSGYFTDKTVKLDQLLKEEEVKESIQQNPERYEVLIPTIKNTIPSIKNNVQNINSL